MIALVKFFLGPMGRWVLVATALLAWTLQQRHQAAEIARGACQEKQLQQTLDEMTRQRNAATQAVSNALKQQASTDQEIVKLEQEKNDAIKMLEERDTGSCLVPDDIIDRLSNIR